MSRELNPGTKAPAFMLPRDGGGTVSLADFAGKKLVLYFYPRADTSGCTKEAIDFSGLKGAFGKAGTEILGVSADPVPAQDKQDRRTAVAAPRVSVPITRVRRERWNFHPRPRHA